MDEKRKSPTGAATSAGAAGEYRADTSSIFKSTSNAADRQGLFALLLYGEANAQTASDLARITGCKDERSVTKEIQRLRRAGAPICANRNGYWISDNADDLARYIKMLNRRIRNIRATCEALVDVLNGMMGQLSLWED